MTIERKNMRKELVALLVGSTLAGNRVFAQRSTPNWYENLPAINIVLSDEKITERDEAPRVYRRKMLVMVECAVTAPTDVEAADLLDDLTEEVEQQLAPNETLDSNANDLVLQGVEIDFKGDGTGPIHAARLMFEAEYFTDAVRTQDLDDLKTTDVEWQLKPTDDAEPEATDQILHTG